MSSGLPFITPLQDIVAVGIYKQVMFMIEHKGGNIVGILSYGAD